jgi:hypothetical protein
MPLQKQNIELPLGQGLDQKTDSWLVAPGKMLALSNGVFSKAGKLTKRNGFASLLSLPSTAAATTLTTFNGNLTAIGSSFYALDSQSSQWQSRGRILPVQLSTKALSRTAYSQSAPDVAVSSNGLGCVVFLDGDGASKYQIVNVATGQTLVSITSLPSSSTGARAFLLGRYFIITFVHNDSGTPKLQYIAIPLTDVSSPSAVTDISTQVGSATAAYDAVVANNTLYIAWNASDGGGAIRMRYMSSTLTQSTQKVFATFTASLLSMVADTSASTPIIWMLSYASSTTKATAVDQSLNTILAPTSVLTSTTLAALTGTASSGTLTTIYDVQQNYSYASIRSDYVGKVTVTRAGVVGSPATVARSVGLASKAFFIDSTAYFLATYGGTYQPTDFLMDYTGNVVAKLAYSNAGGYVTTQVLPQANVDGSSVSIGYRFKALLQAVNKAQSAPSVAGVYAQTGINLATFNLQSPSILTAEIGDSLHVIGGFLWQYDGVKPVEHGFHLWPEDLLATPSTTGGLMTAQIYQYVACYEWTDGAGLVHRSAPSVPLSTTTTGTTASVVLKVPTLRLTYKTSPNDVRIVLYRWSTAQQTFYQISSVTSPTLNDVTADSITYTDTLADSAIIGNNILYTTGGVVENIAAPACQDVSLFGSRLWVIYAEDRNTLGFSKQVIGSTPVEMSDLFTYYAPASTGAEGSTGQLECSFPLDDKLILFKANAIYYLNGLGPNNLGSQNDFPSSPTFVTATVGCANKKSIVFIPSGLIFQSNKGFWLLDRSLNTSYIGAAVEDYNALDCLSAVNVPATNQVRFTMSGGITLIYDYFFQQWGTFTGIPAISSTLYGDLHTYLNSSGEVFQESPGTYLDGSRPVLMSFTTAWFHLADVQGLQRAYFFQLLGKYLSPHKLFLQIAYDYNDSPTQSLTITPENGSALYGDDAFYAQGGQYGGPGNVEKWRVFLSQQKCEAFRITLTEQFDPSLGQGAGAGFSLTGINLVAGMKKGYRTQASSSSAS